jgi:hypothetical protein
MRGRTLFLSTVGAAIVTYAPLACSRDTGGTSTGSAFPSNELVGKVGMQLTLPSGVQLDAVHWAITGPNGAPTPVQAGTVDLHASEAIRFLVGGVPAGSDFAVFFSGTSTDGNVTCVGSASFDVAARITTDVSVALGCTAREPDSGSAFVSASAYDCATVVSLTASPSEAILGGILTVSGSVTGPNTGGLTYSWYASSGSFNPPNAAQTSFTCTAAGLATLLLTATDGPLPDASPCNTALGSMTIQVQCDPASDAGATSDAALSTNPDAPADAAAASDTSSGGATEAGSSDGVLAAAGDTFTAQQGLAFDGPLASFIDTSSTDTAADFDVSIDWGDGAPASVGSVTGSSGTFEVNAVHTYATVGPFTVTTSVTDTRSGSKATATSNTVVSPAEE